MFFNHILLRITIYALLRNIQTASTPGQSITSKENQTWGYFGNSSFWQSLKDTYGMARLVAKCVKERTWHLEPRVTLESPQTVEAWSCTSFNLWRHIIAPASVQWIHNGLSEYTDRVISFQENCKIYNFLWAVVSLRPNTLSYYFDTFEKMIWVCQLR